MHPSACGNECEQKLIERTMHYTHDAYYFTLQIEQELAHACMHSCNEPTAPPPPPPPPLPPPWLRIAPVLAHAQTEAAGLYSCQGDKPHNRVEQSMSTVNFVCPINNACKPAT